MNTKASPNIPSWMNSWAFYVAATLVPFLLGLMAYWKLHPHTTTSFFYYQYIQPVSPDSVWAKVDDQEAKRDLQQIDSLFARKAYKVALKQLEASPSRTHSPEVWHFYKGIAHLELKQKAPALEAFGYVKDAGHALAEDAAWYEALVHVQHNDRAAAIPLLKQIKGKRAGEARALFADIE